MNRLFNYTFPDLFTAEVPIRDEHGIQWAGPGKDGDMAPNVHDLWNAWLLDAIRAKIHGWGISDEVRRYAEANVSLTRAPKVEIKEKPTAVKKPRPYKFSWSYSSLDAFETCPYRWAEERYYRRVKREDTAATIWGKRVHKAFEDYIKTDGQKCAPEEDFAGGVKWAKAVVATKRMGYEVMTEQQMGISREFTGSGWWDAWGRAVIDVSMVKGNEGRVLDWKTGGKIKHDETQLRIFCAFLALLNPDLEFFTADYIWLKHDQKTGFAGLTRDEVMESWEKVLVRVTEMERAVSAEVFPMRRGGLCRSWCPVQSCPHCGR